MWIHGYFGTEGYQWAVLVPTPSVPGKLEKLQANCKVLLCCGECYKIYDVQINEHVQEKNTNELRIRYMIQTMASFIFRLKNSPVFLE